MTGAILILASTVLLWTNEGVAVRTQATLDEAEYALSLDDTPPNRPLFHTTGMLRTEDKLTDVKWGVETQGSRLGALCAP